MNKYKISGFLALTLSWITFAWPCPTCVGRLEQNSPPFFSDEFYQPKKTDQKQKEDKQKLETEKSQNNERRKHE